MKMSRLALLSVAALGAAPAAAQHLRGAVHGGHCDRNTFERHFYELATSFKPTTDKVTAHSYETMYGMFLWPLKHATHTPKVLEIGLGCDMGYGPGASVKVWQTLLPHADLYEAEYDAACVAKSLEKGQLEGIKTLTGDQGNFETLEHWKEQIGSDFDVIIDDGGHTNSQIGHSFDALWPLVKLGGVYVLEDLQVGRSRHYEDTGGAGVMADKIQDWIEQLLTKDPKPTRHKIPDDVAFVFCQLEACVVGKRNQHVAGRPGHPGHDFRKLQTQDVPAARVRRYLRGERVPVGDRG